MWTRFDPGEIREDFARIAALGFDSVRFFLRWGDFQPESESIDRLMLDRLESVVASAGERGLRTMPVLCNGHNSGINWLPLWALERNGARAKNLYSGELLQAQSLFARAVAERLRGHPSVAAWDIGHAFTDVSRPPAGKLRTGGHETESVGAREAAQWAQRLSDELKNGSGLPCTAGTFSADITEERNLRLESLCVPFAFASMQGSSMTVPFARNRLDPEAVPFLAMLAASFSRKAVLVTGIGNPTCPPQKLSLFERFPLSNESYEAVSADDALFAAYPCLTEDEHAAYCANVLERLHADGRLGAYWWCWSDYPEDLALRPPFDRVPHERFCGIIRSDGTEKPIAAALSTFARQRREVVPSRDMPMISSAYYYRTLPKSAQTLYEAFLGSLDR